MTRAKKTRKFAVMKRVLQKKNLPEEHKKQEQHKLEAKKKQEKQFVEKPAAHLFFKHNTALGPPYHILIDTNFINMLLMNRLELVSAMMDCLLAKCLFR
jgi:U3 small nucleolar RNA-associated protein 24